MTVTAFRNARPSVPCPPSARRGRSHRSVPRTEIDLGLERVRRALELLGHPEESFASVVVGGTNGKGSVCAFLESIFRAAGYRTGLFTSPHLVDVRERVRVSGRKISSADWNRLIRRLRSFIHRHRLSLTEFECHALAAALFFAERGVDIAFMEVGLGGRLDATNALPAPEATVVASLGHDHREWLGPTLRHIFREKRSIARPGTPHVQAAPASLRREGDVFYRERLVPVWELGREIRPRLLSIDWARGRQQLDVRLPGRAYRRLCLGLLGPHQADNASLAVATADWLRRRGWVLPETRIREGLLNARWPGRFQIVRRPGGTDVLLDGAHNVEAVESLARTYRLSPWAGGTATLIFACLQDKDAEGMIARLRPLVHRVFTVLLPSPRSRDPESLASLWRAETPAFACRNFADAWSRASRDTGSPILITGSLYLVGEAMKHGLGGAS